MPKDSNDSREKPATKTLADILEALVKEEFVHNRRAIVDQIVSDVANRVLEQNRH